MVAKATMKTPNLMVVLLIILLSNVPLISSRIACNLTEEAESGTTNGVKIPRSEASNKITVRLQESEYVFWAITAHSSCLVQVLDVVYTNDGGSDEISVYVNDQQLGSFTTKSQSDNGHIWNRPESSGSLDDVKQLSVGVNHIRVVATVVDEFGVEIDKAVFGFECDQVCPNITPGEGLSIGEIIGTVSGIVGVVLTCIICCVTVYFGRDKCGCHLCTRAVNAQADDPQPAYELASKAQPVHAQQSTYEPPANTEKNNVNYA